MVRVGVVSSLIPPALIAPVLLPLATGAVMLMLGEQRRLLTAVIGLVSTLAGLALGLGVSLILVFVVNPQSFNWSMDLALPWPRLLVLCAAVVASGTLTAWLAARAAAGSDVVRAVREDW